MKQVLQDLRSGRTLLEDVAAPGSRSGHLLIRTKRSLISAGTERALLEFGRAHLVAKARQRPEQVRQVLEKVRTDGIVSAMEAVRARLEQPSPLGYCNVGTVLDVGSGVRGFAAGDRVASNGKHAEVVSVPSHLCARIPDGVDDDDASFTVVSAIALQAIRLVAPTLGERIVVSGLGLIGLLAAQLLRAHGCAVLGIDVDPGRIERARSFGVETVDLRTQDPVEAAVTFSRGRGVDGVVIAAATRSNDPISQAARMSRKRGRIVLVGVVGLELSRADFYEKELTFQVSCSYGPGRYDAQYEEGGHDYPVGFVRWTEQRNFEAVLDMLAERRLEVAPLISHRFPIDEAERAYEVLGGPEPSLGIILDYPERAVASRQVTFPRVARGRANRPSPAVLGVIGAGSYARQRLLPAFAATSAIPHAVASAQGASASYAARRFGYATATTDATAMIDDPAVTAVVVATRHDSHARFVTEALAAGKHVFVEKPLCRRRDELALIERAYASHGGGPMVMVGFNRRFAPHVVAIKRALADVREPKAMTMVVNAGAVPPDHWTQDPEIGGGRIIGEACHFIDLLRFLAGAPIVDVRAYGLGGASGTVVREDEATIVLRFADGSVGTIAYLANGSRTFPKERLEVFCAGGVLQMENYRVLRGFGWPGFKNSHAVSQDKGQRACVAAFVEAVQRGTCSPIPFDEIVEVTNATFDVAEHVRTR